MLLWNDLKPKRWEINHQTDSCVCVVVGSTENYSRLINAGNFLQTGIKGGH